MLKTMTTATNNDEKLKVWNKNFHILAMKDELKQLERKTYSFEKWIKNTGEDAFKGRIDDQWSKPMLILAKKQIRIMRGYINVLKVRIKLFEDYGID